MLIFFKKYLKSKLDNFNDEIKTTLNILLKRNKKNKDILLANKKLLIKNNKDLKKENRYIFGEYNYLIFNNDEIKKRNKNLQFSIEELKNSNLNLLGENKNMKSSLEEIIIWKDNLLQEKDALLKTNAEIIKWKDNLIQENNELTILNNTIISKNKDLSKNNKELQESYNQIDSYLDQLTNDNAKLNKYNDEIIKWKDNLLQEKNDLLKTNTEIIKWKDNLLQEKNDLLKTNTEINIWKDNLIKEKDALLKTNTEIKNWKDNLIKEKEALLKTNTEINNWKENLIKENQSLISRNKILEELFLSAENIIFCPSYSSCITLLTAGLNISEENSQNEIVFTKKDLFIIPRVKNLKEPLLWIFEKFHLRYLFVDDFNKLNFQKINKVWIHSYASIEPIKIFLENNSYKNLYLYSDGLKNITTAYPAEKINKENRLFDNDNYPNIKKYIYFGWMNEKEKEGKTSYIFNKKIFKRNLNFLIEKLSIEFNFNNYVDSLQLKNCSNKDLVIFARYYSFDEVYRFKDKESQNKFSNDTAKLLKNKTNSKKVFLITDDRCSEEFINTFCFSLKEYFEEVVCSRPESLKPSLPGEVISYYLSKNSPNTFIYSFDGGMSFISKLLGCKNSFYLDLPEEFNDYFFHPQTFEMIKKQISIYQNMTL